MPILYHIKVMCTWLMTAMQMAFNIWAQTSPGQGRPLPRQKALALLPLGKRGKERCCEVHGASTCRDCEPESVLVNHKC